MTEVWKAIPGFEGAYEVSDLGRVRSLDRIVESPAAKRGYPKRVRGRILRPQKHSGGYLQVQLHGSTHLIPWLVLEAFVGARPSGMEACHNGGDKSDNRLSELRWDTHVDNCKDRIAHGTAPRGERNGSAVLDTAAVLDIRSGGDRKALAEQYGVRPTHIDRIRARGRWAHV
jgi:hypothetical protein